MLWQHAVAAVAWDTRCYLLLRKIGTTIGALAQTNLAPGAAPSSRGAFTNIERMDLDFASQYFGKGMNVPPSGLIIYLGSGGCGGNWCADATAEATTAEATAEAATAETAE